MQRFLEPIIRVIRAIRLIRDSDNLTIQRICALFQKADDDKNQKNPYLLQNHFYGLPKKNHNSL